MEYETTDAQERIQSNEPVWSGLRAGIIGTAPGGPSVTYGRRIALRSVLDALDQGATIRQIIDACAIIEPSN